MSHDETPRKAETFELVVIVTYIIIMNYQGLNGFTFEMTSLIQYFMLN